MMPSAIGISEFLRSSLPPWAMRPLRIRAAYSRSVFGFALCVAVSSSSFAESDTDPAHHIVNRAIVAHGGQSVEHLRSMIQEWRTTDATVFESLKPSPPWDVVHRWEAFAADFESRHYAEARIDRASGYEWITGLVLNSQGGHRLDYRTESYRDTPTSFEQAVLDMAAWSPVVLLRLLNDHTGAVSYVEQRELEGTQVDVINVELGGEVISIFFGAESGQIRALERGYTDYDGTHVPMRFIYSNMVTESGLHNPNTVELWIHGFLARQAALVSMQVDQSINPYLAVPDTFEPTPTEPDGIRAFRVEELADGVLFLGAGVMYQLIVEFDGFLVALDGGSGNVMKRIDAARDRIPDKDFRYVLASHHHNDHLHGLDEFAGVGADIVASRAHANTIVSYMAGEAPGITPTILLVEDQIVVRSGSRELQIIDVGPVPHSDHMLVAYLPKEKILFEADLFVLGGQRHPVRPASLNAVALLRAIDSLGLEVQQIVDPHSPVIATIDDLRQSVALRQAKGTEIHANARAYLSKWKSSGKEFE